MGQARFVNLRGYLIVYVNLCWAIGQFIVTGVCRLTSKSIYEIVKDKIERFTFGALVRQYINHFDNPDEHFSTRYLFRIEVA